MQPCPECGSTDRKQEPGEYALLQLTQGRLELNVKAPNNAAVVVRATVCRKCSHVALHESV